MTAWPASFMVLYPLSQTLKTLITVQQQTIIINNTCVTQKYTLNLKMRLTLQATVTRNKGKKTEGSRCKDHCDQQCETNFTIVFY